MLEEQEDACKDKEPEEGGTPLKTGEAVRTAAIMRKTATQETTVFYCKVIEMLRGGGARL